MDNSGAGEEQQQKKGRHRKKQLYSSILQQMEFYFSDSNLTKDRFMSQLLQNDSNIDLSVFLKFNKIRKLTLSIDDLVKAIKKSEILELSDDNSKVYRKTPVLQKENVDDCTIYIENIKSDATHEWLRSIFTQFGNIAYVSIPRYRNNNLNKGFAFIEFENAEDTKNALQFFEEIGCKMSSQILPEQLMSITTFEPKEESTFENNKKRKHCNSGDNDNTESDEKNTIQAVLTNEECDIVPKKCVENEAQEESKKRKRSNSEDADNTGNENKKGDKKNVTEVVLANEKCNIVPKNRVENKDQVESKEESKKRKRSNSEDTDNTGNENKKNVIEAVSNNEECNIVPKKHVENKDQVKSKEENKKRKRSNSGDTDNTGNGNKESDEKNVIEVLTNEDSNIVSKKPKKHVENEEQLSENNSNNGESKVDTDLLNETNENDTNIGDKKKNKRLEKRKALFKEIGLHVLSKKEWKKMRNKYLNMQKEKMKALKAHLNKKRFAKYSEKVRTQTEVDENNKKEKKKTIEFKPGVIMKVQLPEPSFDTKKLKMDIKNCSQGVEYIDVPSTASEVIYIRFSNNDYAEQFLKCTFNGAKSLLKDTLEKEYWDKINKDLELKVNKDKRKQRGRTKLLKRAERELGKHIRFDDSE